MVTQPLQFRDNAVSAAPITEGGRPTAGIDVAIPCYNYGRFLRDSIESALAQPLTGLRILVIDNASTDNSREVAQQLAAENPAVDVVAHPRNVGPHASFNEAIDWAAQRYFLLLCADDLLAPGALARAVAILEEHPEAVMSYGRAALLVQGMRQPFFQPESGIGNWKILSGGALLERFCGSGICHIAGCTAVVRTEVQKQVGYYRPELPHTDDFEMWLRFTCHGSVAETSAIQGATRAHETSQSAFVRQQHRWDILHCGAAFTSFFAQEGGHLSDGARLHNLAKRSLGERAYWSAAAHLTRREFGEFLALLRLALRLRPRCVVAPPISYLTRREDARTRLFEVLSGLAGKPSGIVRSHHLDG